MANVTPKIDLDEYVICKVGDILADIWPPGARQEMTLYLAGILVKRGIRHLSARAIVARASTKTGADTDKRLKDVDSVYVKWLSDEAVEGAPGDIENILMDHTPASWKEKVLQAFRKAMKLIPDQSQKKEEPETAPFKIVSIVMFNSKPAHWQVTLEVKDGTRHTTTVQTSVFTRYNLFRDAFLEDTLTLLPDIKNSEWARLIEACGQPEVKSAPLQAVGAETMKEPLVQFLAEAKENPDAGTLRAFAGEDQDSHYFRYSAFDNFLRSSNLTFDRQAAYDMLKTLGFENTTKRMGDKTVNVWIKKKDQAP